MNPVWDCASTMVKYGAWPRYWHRAALYLLKLAAFEPFRWAERLAMRWRGEPGELPTPPVFILGYYRSGTTHLQEALLEDPQLAYMNFYQCFFPTAFSSTQGWVQPLFEAIITRTSYLHPAHRIPFSFDLPGEEDVSMVASGSRLAANWGQVLPQHFKEIYARTALLEGTEEELQAFSQQLHDLIWRVSKAHGHKRLLLKSPPHTGRLRLLRELYPQAKFIFIRRDPFEVFGSNLKLWRSFEENHLQPISRADVRENIVWSHDRAHANYERDKRGLPDDQLCEVTFEDFMADPMAVLQRIYTQLELGDFEQVAPRFAAYLETHHDAAPRDYDLNDADRAAVEERLARWMEEWGYDPPRLRASAS